MQRENEALRAGVTDYRRRLEQAQTTIGETQAELKRFECIASQLKHVSTRDLHFRRVTFICICNRMSCGRLPFRVTSIRTTAAVRFLTPFKTPTK